ncbi:virulence factor MviN [Streptomonospora sp. S1-112]|uniref:Virulence factor MviN n=1 Tax=Streptomonospora mangrovi TaxID=2883123 RepID=A0A9X3NMW1_9ACTN|nr:lipid II flippase MurJ [Streptomonospora mangrovi]MDA0566417.1 virulence factor MviN [Streptomonospora mangrovi]
MTPLRLGAGVAGAAVVIAGATALARLAGFGRTVVFSQTVGDTCLGTAYVTANQLPTVLFETVIGGAVAGMVVPVLASAAARGDREHVEHTASALLTWVVVAAVPLSALTAALAVPAMSVLLGPAAGCDRDALLALAARFLLVFAPQVLLYGLAAVLYGILQAHRRFLAPALAPLVSSVVVIAAYIAFVPLAGAHRDDPARLPAAAELALSAGTTAGVAALLLTALPPARRLRLRLRPRLSFPPGTGGRARALAAAALLPPAAMQGALLLNLALANRGGGGAAVVQTYAWTLFTLPYGIVAVPIATSAFTALSVRHGERDRDGFAATLAGSARALVMATGLLAAALAGAAEPVAAVFARNDPAGLHRALIAYAPGVLGFGLGALLSRALYASHHGRSAATAQVAGWAAVMACGAALVAAVPPGWTVAALGAGASTGLTLAAVLLAVATRAAHGRAALAGLGRALLAALVGGLLGAAAGAGAAGLVAGTGTGAEVAGAAVAAAASSAVFALAASALDPSSARAALARLRRPRAAVPGAGGPGGGAS